MYFKKYFKNYYLAQRKISGGKITQDDVFWIFQFQTMSPIEKT